MAFELQERRTLAGVSTEEAFTVAGNTTRLYWIKARIVTSGVSGDVSIEYNNTALTSWESMFTDGTAGGVLTTVAAASWANSQSDTGFEGYAFVGNEGVGGGLTQWFSRGYINQTTSRTIFTRAHLAPGAEVTEISINSTTNMAADTEIEIWKVT